MVLAICGLGGSNASKEAVNNNMLASNYFNFFQAKNMRQTVAELAADELNTAGSRSGHAGESTKQAMQAKLDQYRKTIARYESEPETREGKKELLSVRASTRRSATTRSSRTRISTMPRRCCRSRSC